MHYGGDIDSNAQQYGGNSDGGEQRGEGNSDAGNQQYGDNFDAGNQQYMQGEQRPGEPPEQHPDESNADSERHFREALENSILPPDGPQDGGDGDAVKQQEEYAVNEQDSAPEGSDQPSDNAEDAAPILEYENLAAGEKLLAEGADAAETQEGRSDNLPPDADGNVDADADGEHDEEHVDAVGEFPSREELKAHIKEQLRENRKQLNMLERERERREREQRFSREEGELQWDSLRSEQAPPDGGPPRREDVPRDRPQDDMQLQPDRPQDIQRDEVRQDEVRSESQQPEQQQEELQQQQPGELSESDVGNVSETARPVSGRGRAAARKERMQRYLQRKQGELQPDSTRSVGSQPDGMRDQRQDGLQDQGGDEPRHDELRQGDGLQPDGVQQDELRDQRQGDELQQLDGLHLDGLQPDGPQRDEPRDQRQEEVRQQLQQLEQQREEQSAHVEQQHPILGTPSESANGNDSVGRRANGLYPSDLLAALDGRVPDPVDARGNPANAEGAAGEGARENGETGAPDEARGAADGPNTAAGEGIDPPADSTLDVNFPQARRVE